MHIENGSTAINVENKAARITFSHPKGNSLPSILLKELTNKFNDLGKHDDVKVIVLQSKGTGAFCAGASFEEIQSIKDFETGKEFFMGFARLILTMIRCPKVIITRVQGKAVGGGVGIIAASDYALALNTASIRLSELSLSLGPFVVGPVVEKKIGLSAFSALSIDTEWRDASWAKSFGLYSNVYNTIEKLDSAVNSLSERISKYNPEAILKLKSIFWERTEHWDQLLESRAEMSGRLVLSRFTSEAIDLLKRKS
jgi:methylglutaconyl-CoA hydratase